MKKLIMLNYITIKFLFINCDLFILTFKYMFLNNYLELLFIYTLAYFTIEKAIYL